MTSDLLRSAVKRIHCAVQNTRVVNCERKAESGFVVSANSGTRIPTEIDINAVRAVMKFVKTVKSGMQRMWLH